MTDRMDRPVVEMDEEQQAIVDAHNLNEGMREEMGSLVKGLRGEGVNMGHLNEVEALLDQNPATFVVLQTLMPELQRLMTRQDEIGDRARQLYQETEKAERELFPQIFDEGGK
jgi:transposase